MLSYLKGVNKMAKRKPEPNPNIAPELKRANKLRAQWKRDIEGDKYLLLTFYKTREKIAEIASNSTLAVSAGYKFPDNTEDVVYTGKQLKAHFESFVLNNLGLIGVKYDTNDMRADTYKYPNKFDNDSAIKWGETLTDAQVSKVIEKLNLRIARIYIERKELIKTDTEATYKLGKSEVVITEAFKDGSIKYGMVRVPVVISLKSKKIEYFVLVNINSGQISKPRLFNDEKPITMTAVIDDLTEAGVLPKIEPTSKMSDEVKAKLKESIAAKKAKKAEEEKKKKEKEAKEAKAKEE
jgi:hypothetical protein